MVGWGKLATSAAENFFPPPVSEVWALILWVRRLSADRLRRLFRRQLFAREEEEMVELRAAKEMKRWELRVNRDKCLKGEQRRCC